MTNSLLKPTVFISGSNGFLGKNLQNYINIHNLQCQYNFLTPPSKILDILDNKAVLSFFDTHKPDVVIHGAAICGGIGKNKRQPADLTHLNNKMTVNLFDAIREFGINQLIGIGSICSYPMYSPIPFKEENIWDGKSEKTNRGYGESKKMLITEFQSHKEQYNLAGVILMPTNLFGPYEHFDDIENSHVIPGLITKFVNAVEKRISFVNCWGSGNPTRDFIFAPSVCNAIITALVKNTNEYEPINIGSGYDISMYDLAHLIAEIVGFDGDIIFDGNVSDGQPKRLLCIDRAKNILGWKPDIEFRDGLIQTIDWYRANKP